MTTDRALVLSGGAAKGSVQAGMVLRMTEAGITHDAYYGTSVGAISAAHMAQYAWGDELKGAMQLVAKWHALTTRQVYRRRWLHWLRLPWCTSVYDTSPLREYLAANIDSERYAKSCSVGLVALRTGQHVVVRQPKPAIVYGSAAFPVMFEPGPALTSDGGLVHVTPLAAAIVDGYDHIDVITLDAPGVPSWSGPPTKWWQPKLHHVALRSLEVVIQNNIERDLRACQAHNTRVAAGRSDPGKRHVDLRVWRPPEPLPIDPFDFSPATNAWGIAYGYDLMGTLLASD